MSATKLPRRSLTLALALTPGIGAKTITRILTRNDMFGRSPDEFLTLGEETLREEYKVKAPAARAWTQKQDQWLTEAAEIEQKLEPHGVSLVTAADAHYPRRIEAMLPDPPGLLYLYGNRRLLEADTFCVLASRRSSDAMLKEIELFTEERVLSGKTLVSSHDTPEYQRSAVTALRWGAPRIMVFDTGLFNALGDDLTNEPFPAARLWRYSFDKQTDLAVSFTNPFRPYHRNGNRIRDGLVASLALHLDVVNASAGGNVERLAKYALRAGRPVRTSEHSVHSERLVNLGAQLVPMRQV